MKYHICEMKIDISRMIFHICDMIIDISCMIFHIFDMKLIFYASNSYFKQQNDILDMKFHNVL